ncbi:MAG: hypothetical protein ACTSSE_16700 [Candidatus Thorarchaeota archaeon]
MKTLNFVSTLPLEIVVEAFREEFGDFDRNPEGKGEWKDSLIFAWPSNPFILTASKDPENTTYHCHYRGRGNEKRIRKVKGILTCEDLWLSRKVLSSYLDPKREKRNKDRFRNRLLGLGLILTIFDITLIGSGVLLGNWLALIVGSFISIVDVVAVSIVWIVYRIGVTEDAVDLRIFSIAFFYMFLGYGVPFSLLSILLGSIVPVEGDYSWVIFAVVTLMLFFGYFWTTRIINPYLQPKLRQEWNEIRVDIDRSTDPESLEQKPLVANLWAAAFISYPRALSPSNWIVAIVLFSTWAIRFLGDSWFWVFFIVPVFLVWFMISWDIGLEFGIKEAAKKLRETGPYEIHFGEYVVQVNFGIKPDSKDETV